MAAMAAMAAMTENLVSLWEASSFGRPTLKANT